MSFGKAEQGGLIVAIVLFAFGDLIVHFLVPILLEDLGFWEVWAITKATGIVGGLILVWSLGLGRNS